MVDDNQVFVDSLVGALEEEGLDATGCSSPVDVLSWRERDRFSFDLILLDMRLGTSKGRSLSAAILLPHLKTYAPSVRVVVFSQAEVTVEECVRCIRLGALTVIPKSAAPQEIALIARVYDAIGDTNRSREELIRVLWDDIRSSPNGEDGRKLEMLLINLFESMTTFPVVGNNMVFDVGEIDILIQNHNTHPFWKALDSVEIVVECKHRKEKSPPAALSQLKELVLSRGGLSRVGIFVSVSSVTSGHRSRQVEARREGMYMYYLDSTHLGRLVELPIDDREQYLREVFIGQ